jgi:RNA polymerase sigma factor (sigma-70 family)
VSDKSDYDLVDAFVQGQTDAAFREIVRRYVDLVYSVALRLVADVHLAQDVSQAVFVALARQAGAVQAKLRRGVPLSGWLHVTTRNLAAKAVRTETRRRAREQAAVIMDTFEAGNASWERLAPDLDDALAKLPETDRHALLLRFFEKRTAREIGLRLGLSEEAAQKRIARALERLRQQFAAAGLGVSVAGLVTLLGSEAVQAAPSALAGTITAAILQSGAATAAGLGAVSPLSKLGSALLMTKSQAMMLSGIAILAVVPLARQQLTLTRVQAELAAAHQGLPVQSVDASVGPGKQRTSESEELDRLRRAVLALRAGISNAQTAAVKPASSKRPLGEVRLIPGRSVPFEELAFAGIDTPQAALQSYLAAERDGEVEAALGLMLQPISSEDARMLESEDGRDQAKAELRHEVDDIRSVELLGERPISDRRTQLVCREIRADRVRTNIVSLGRCADGWKVTL